MAKETSIKQIIQNIAGSDGVEVLQGIVKSASPLSIKIINDDKREIGSGITYIPRHLTDYTANCSLAKGDKDNPAEVVFSGNITIHNALKTGEEVFVLSFNRGKQYYVFDRVG